MEPILGPFSEECFSGLESDTSVDPPHLNPLPEGRGDTPCGRVLGFKGLSDGRGNPDSWDDGWTPGLGSDRLAIPLTSLQMRIFTQLQRSSPSEGRGGTRIQPLGPLTDSG